MHARKRHQRFVFTAIKDQMFIHLVTQRDDVMLDAQIGNKLQFVVAINLRTGVLRRVDQDQLGFSLKAAASSSRGNSQCGGVTRTSLGIPPASFTIGR